MAQDFVVIGAGIMGLATAAKLLQEGAAVTILERGEVGGESSWAGGGILSPLFPSDYPDEVTRLTDYSAALFPEWVDELRTTTGIDAEYEVSGMLVLPPHRLESKSKVPINEQNSLFLPKIAQVRNPRLLHALRDQIVQLKGRIVEHCEVQEIVERNNQVIYLATEDRKYSADYFVVAAGAWSTRVLGKYAINLDIRPIRGQMLLYKFAELPLQSIVLQQDLYLIPRRDGHLLVGSTMEDVGFNRQITLSARSYLVERAQKLLPQLKDMPLIKHWAGLRPASPHNIPTIGRHPELRNLYINSGHFRYGLTMAPGSATILLNEIMGRPQPFATFPYQQGWGVS